MFYVVFVIVALCCSQILGFNSQNTSLMPKPETSQILSHPSPPPLPLHKWGITALQSSLEVKGMKQDNKKKMGKKRKELKTQDLMG